MKKTSGLQTAPVHRSLGEGGFFNLRVSIGLLTFVAGVFLVLFVTANPSKGGWTRTARTLEWAHRVESAFIGATHRQDVRPSHA
jgi:hypothetical protein